MSGVYEAIAIGHLLSLGLSEQALGLRFLGFELDHIGVAIGEALRSRVDKILSHLEQALLVGKRAVLLDCRSCDARA